MLTVGAGGGTVQHGFRVLARADHTNRVTARTPTTAPVLENTSDEALVVDLLCCCDATRAVEECVVGITAIGRPQVLHGRVRDRHSWTGQGTSISSTQRAMRLFK